MTNMKNKIKNIIVTAIIVAAGLPIAASAQLPTIVPACARGAATPSLNCILVFFATVAQWILGISGSLALFYFVYGGVRILLSRGNANAVGAGKTILTQAVIGIIIIFGAYLGVSFLVQNVLKATGVPSAEEASQKAGEGHLTEPLSGQSGQKSPTPTSPTPAQKAAEEKYKCWCGDTLSTAIFSWPACETMCPKQCAIQKLSGTPTCDEIK